MDVDATGVVTFGLWTELGEGGDGETIYITQLEVQVELQSLAIDTDVERIEVAIDIEDDNVAVDVTDEELPIQDSEPTVEVDV